MAASKEVGFSWVNYTNTSVNERDDEDVSIIKSHTMRVVHRQRQKRAQRVNTDQGERATSQPPQEALQVDHLRRASGNIAHHPGTDWEEVAICQLLEAFVYPDQSSPVVAFQYLSFLPELYGKSFARSCLTEAIRAVALARLANVNRVPDLALRARKSYTDALSLVSKTMSVPEQQKSDQVLATLCMLAKYELISGDANDRLFQSHERGQVALIRGRDQGEWLSSNASLSLFRLVYIRHLLSCIATSEQPGLSLSPGNSELVFPAPCLRQLMALIRKIASVRSQLQQRSRSSTETHQLAEYALKIDADMTALIQRLPADMIYYSITENPKPAGGITESWAPPAINIFPDIQHASFWHVFFYGQLYILQALLHFPEQTKLSPEVIHTRLLRTVDDICASVPFALNENDCSSAFVTTKGGGAVAAHYVTWLLASALAVEGVPDGQKKWMADRLAYIGHAHGINAALRAT